MRREPGGRLIAAGGGLVGALAVVALLAPWLAPGDPNEQLDPAAGRLRPPGTTLAAVELQGGRWLLADRVERTAAGLRIWRRGETRLLAADEVANLTPDGVAGRRRYLLGTDRYGRDLASRLVFGARTSLTISLASLALALLLGVGVGGLAGAAGGVVDSLLMRAVDAFLVFPRLFLILAVAALVPTSPAVVVAVLGGTSWMTLSRLVRGQVRSLGRREFVLAARATGQRPWRILVRHLLPNALVPVIVDATLRVGDLILLEASMSFLGLGVQPPTPSWGNMIADGRDLLRSAPWVSALPGLLIAATVIGFNLLGDGLRERLDPRGDGGGSVLTDDFDYVLPDEAIAQRPAPRGTSRLLVLDEEGPERHRRVADLPRLLETGDLLVVNETRVIRARLFARRPTGGRVELLLVERLGPAEWDALVKPGRRARPGARLTLENLEVEVLAKADDGRHRIRFSEPVEPHLPRLGHVPLPPYIKRGDEATDRDDYQTVFARNPGAIAAPTAGLHFTPELLAALEAAGVRRAAVTLHVGIGTFKPVTARLVHEHRMERERYEIPPATTRAIERTKAAGGRIVAVGTTVVRTLEGAAAGHPEHRAAGTGATDLFITPGFRFRVVDLLLTNFHLPRSTLLMLVSALAGRERVLAAYREAIGAGYRFYSYGDAMLVRRSR